MRYFICALMLIVGMGLAGGAIADAVEGAQEAALSATEEWIALVDAEKYEDSWESAATYFKDAVSKEQWRLSADSVRKPLGSLVSRRLKSAQHMTTLPGAPDGAYFVLQYDTVFKNKQQAVETITPMLDKDGKWRVSGYYIR